MSPLTRRRGKHYEAYRLGELGRQAGRARFTANCCCITTTSQRQPLDLPPPSLRPLLPIRRLHPFRVLVVACHYIQNSNRISIHAAAKLNRVDFPASARIFPRSRPREEDASRDGGLRRWISGIRANRDFQVPGCCALVEGLRCSRGKRNLVSVVSTNQRQNADRPARCSAPCVRRASPDDCATQEANLPPVMKHQIIIRSPSYPGTYIRWPPLATRSSSIERAR